MLMQFRSTLLRGEVNLIQSKKILFVECMYILSNLKVYLEIKDFSVDIAESGRDAIKKIMAQNYDLIISESKLSDMECTELLEKIQKVTPNTIKIIVTNYPSLKNVIYSLNLGVNAYFLLPIESEQFLKTIKKKLKEQEEVGKMDQEKITEMIKARIRMLNQ